MNPFFLIIKELWFRKTNFMLSLIAVCTAVTFTVAFQTTYKAAEKETARLMRDMGYNLRIIPKEVKRSEFLADGYSEVTMPEDYAVSFANHKDLSFTHILATLNWRIDWNGQPVVLHGIASELSPPDKQKPSMIFEIEPGSVYVGYELAKDHGITRGDTVEIMNRTFTVAHTLQETGTQEDIWLFTHLSDAQAMLNLEGRINEIRALDCYCRIPGVDPIDILRQELATVFPEAQLFQMKPIAEARQSQRHMMEQYFSLIMPVVVIACGLWIGAMAFLNTKDRRYEIGVLRALGYGTGVIATLFLGKSILIGALGAGTGFLLGSGIALLFAPDIFVETGNKISMDMSLLWWSLLLAPLFSAFSSLIPTALAVTQDPAIVLREE